MQSYKDIPPVDIVLPLTHDGERYFNIYLTTFKALYNELVKKVPSEYRAQAAYVAVSPSGISIIYERPMTDAEYEIDLLNDLMLEAETENYERDRLAELMKKYHK